MHKTFSSVFLGSALGLQVGGLIGLTYGAFTCDSFTDDVAASDIGNSDKANVVSLKTTHNFENAVSNTLMGAGIGALATGAISGATSYAAQRRKNIEFTPQ